MTAARNGRAKRLLELLDEGANVNFTDAVRRACARCQHFAIPTSILLAFVMLLIPRLWTVARRSLHISTQNPVRILGAHACGFGRSPGVCASSSGGRSRQGVHVQCTWDPSELFFSSDPIWYSYYSVPRHMHIHQNGDRALHCAAMMGHTECLLLLLESGANVNAENDVRLRICLDFKLSMCSFL